jgi:hypothetical protein
MLDTLADYLTEVDAQLPRRRSDGQTLQISDLFQGSEPSARGP